MEWASQLVVRDENTSRTDPGYPRKVTRIEAWPLSFMVSSIQKKST